MLTIAIPPRNEAKQRIDSINKRRQDRDKTLLMLAKITKEGSSKFLYNRKEQALEQRVFKNMSVHNLKVRWIKESDYINKFST